MKEEKSPVDILDEIMNRGVEPPRPSTHPPKFDPPPPEDDPKPPVEKKAPPLMERLTPWALGLTAAAVALCGAMLFSVGARLDGLGAAVGELRTVDELRKENEKLQRENDGLRKQLDSQSDAAYELALEDAMRAQRTEFRMRQSEYLYYMERFVEQGDLPMAALVMTLEDDVLRPPGPGDPYRIPLGDAVTVAPSLDFIHQMRYDEIQQRLVVEGVLDLDGAAPLWPSGTGPSEDPAMAAQGILWCAMDQYYIRGNSEAAAFFLVQKPLNRQNLSWRELLLNSGEHTAGLYWQLISDLTQEGCILEQEDGSLAWAQDYFHTDLYYALPFELPPLPWDSPAQ